VTCKRCWSDTTKWYNREPLLPTIDSPSCSERASRLVRKRRQRQRRANSWDKYKKRENERLRQNRIAKKKDVNNSIINMATIFFVVPDLGQVRLQTCSVPAPSSSVGGLLSSSSTASVARAAPYRMSVRRLPLRRKNLPIHAARVRRSRCVFGQYYGHRATTGTVSPGKGIYSKRLVEHLRLFKPAAFRTYRDSHFHRLPDD
jgi:hypothetical protein